MNKNIFKSIFIIAIMIFTLFVISCDIFKDFEDETFEMGVADNAAKGTLSDTSYSVYTALLKDYDSTNYLLEFSNGIKDTIPISEIYGENSKSDLYHALDEVEAGIRVNDDFYTFDTTFTYDTTVFTYDTTISGIDTTVVPDSFAVDTTTNITDHLTSYQVKTFSDTTKSYLLFDNVTSGYVVFFFTDYIYMNLYDEDGNILEIEDSNMPLETISGYFVVSGKNPSPVVKSRFACNVEAKKYLIELITHDQTVSRTFKAAIHFDK